MTMRFLLKKIGMLFFNSYQSMRKKMGNSVRMMQATLLWQISLKLSQMLVEIRIMTL